MSLRGLSDFIREHRDLSAANGSKKATRKLHEVTRVKDLVNMGCGQESKLLCVLVTHNEDETQAIREECLSTLRSIGDEPMVLATLSKSSFDWERFGEPEGTRVLVIKPARGKYYAETIQTLTSADLRGVLDKAVGGSLSFKPLKGLFSSYFKNLDLETDL